MIEAMEQMMAVGIPTVGISGPYTPEGMAEHVAVDPCRWHELASGWYRVDLSGDVDDAQDAQIQQILEDNL